MSDEAPTRDDRDELDLATVVTVLRRRWIVVLVAMIAAMLVCMYQLRQATPIYQVEMKVAAVEHSAYLERVGRSDAPGLPNSINPRQRLTAATAFSLYVESLQSLNVADALAGNSEAMRIAFPGDTVGRAAVGPNARSWSLLAWPHAPASNPAARMRRFLLENVILEQEPKKHAFATVGIQSPRPESAARFLALLHEATDDRIRRNALVASQQMIARLQALPNAQNDAVVNQALGEERVVEAAALASAPFAAQLLDDPSPGREPINSPLRMLASAVVIGLAGGVGLALALDWLIAVLAKRRTKPPNADMAAS